VPQTNQFALGRYVLQENSRRNSPQSAKIATLKRFILKGLGFEQQKVAETNK